MHILIVLIVVACLHSDKKGKCYIERVKMVAENKYRVDSGMNAQKVPEFIQAMKDRGHHLDIKLKSMEEMKDSVAELFNAEMERRRGEDATLPIFDISGQEVMSFVGDGGLPHYCDDWHVIFKNYAPIIPARVGVDEPMFNPNFASDYAHSHSCKQLGGYYIVGYPDCDRRNRIRGIRYRAGPESFVRGWRGFLEACCQVEPAMRAEAEVWNADRSFKCHPRAVHMSDGDKGQDLAIKRSHTSQLRCIFHFATVSQHYHSTVANWN